MKMFIFICVHAWETNTLARVKLYEMSRSCWRWSVSQFSTCTSLSRHGWQSHSFWNSQDDSQMYTFCDQMNWQFVQCTGQRWHKTKDFFDFCSGKICLVLFHGLFLLFSSSVFGTRIKCQGYHYSHPLHPLITWIYCECKLQNGLIL